MKIALNLDKAQIASFCERWRIQQLELFGSVLRADFGPESDLDFLVVYKPNARITLFDEAQMQEELASLLGRPVDLVSRRAVEASPNWIRRKAILGNAELFYVAS